MKLNYFTFTLMDWRELALIILIFDPWLFKVACDAPPSKADKEGFQFPKAPKVLIGLADLDLEAIEMFLPPPLWHDVSKTITQIEYDKGGPGAKGEAR